MSACWREPMNITAIRYDAGCQKYEQRAIATAIESHSSAVAASALAGSSTDNSLIFVAGSRSGMTLLVLCGCWTTGFTEMSSTGFSDRRKAIILVSCAKGCIGPYSVLRTEP